MKCPTTIVLLFLFLNLSYGQSLEIGGSAGETGYYGDLNENIVLPEKIQPSFTAFAKYNINERFSARLSYTHGSLAGTDVDNNDPELRKRNLHFRSQINDVAIMAEYNILKFSEYYGNGITPYVTLGVAGFHFNPEAKYEGEWYDLQPLHTEGQGTSTFPDREPYSLYQIAIPFGLGVKAELTEHIIVGFEAVWRKTFTDYIDDVSKTYADPETLRENHDEIAVNLSNRTGEPVTPSTQRGTAWLKDMYQFVGLSISYRFSLDGISKEKVACPATKW